MSFAIVPLATFCSELWRFCEPVANDFEAGNPYIRLVLSEFLAPLYFVLKQVLTARSSDSSAVQFNGQS